MALYKTNSMRCATCNRPRLLRNRNFAPAQARHRSDDAESRRLAAETQSVIAGSSRRCLRALCKGPARWF